MTKIHMEPKWADVKPSGYYVYIHYRNDTMEPFYVGKGKRRRGWLCNEYDCRSKYWINCARKHGVYVAVCQDGLSEKDAYLLEMWMIAKLRHEGNKLVNLTDGGEGYTGGHQSSSKEVYCSNGMHFESVSAASRWIRRTVNGKALPPSIHACCRGEVEIAYGHRWSYDGPPKKSSRRGKTARRNVRCSNGMKFNSTYHAREWMRENGFPNASQGNISAACRGDRPRANGFTWWYED